MPPAVTDAQPQRLLHSADPGPGNVRCMPLRLQKWEPRWRANEVSAPFTSLFSSKILINRKTKNLEGNDRYRHLPFQFPHGSKINTFIFIHQTLHFLHLQTTQFRSKDKWVYKKHLLSTKQLIVKRWLFLAPRYRIPIRFNSSAPRLAKPQAPPEPLVATPVFLGAPEGGALAGGQSPCAREATATSAEKQQPRAHRLTGPEKTRRHRRVHLPVST